MGTFYAVAHHLAVLTLFFCALETILQLQQPFSLSVAKRVSMTDLCNSVAATLVLIFGLTRLFYFEKGSDYYFQNAPFIIKLGLYVVASLLSIIPTLEVRRWRAPLKNAMTPIVSLHKLNNLRTVAYLQLGCLAAMAICARLASRGTDWKVFTN